MTHLAWHLAARACLALLAIAAARRVPALRAGAALAVSMLVVDCGALWPAPWLRIARHVAWPGLLLAGAAWGLRVANCEIEQFVNLRINGPKKRRARDASPEPSASPDAPAPYGGPTGRAERRSGGASLFLPRALLGGYLAAALLALAWRPAYPALLVGGRVLAVGVVVALLARGRPRTWAQLAAVLPAIGLAVGVVAGAWPLAQAGLAAVAAGWHLARLETAATMLATAGAIAAAWQGQRRAGARA